MQLLSVVVLTFNEGKHIARALRSLAPLDAQIFVVDSFSTDATVEIARPRGLSLSNTPSFIKPSKCNGLLQNLPIATAWVMRLDADEVLTTELNDEIKTSLADLAVRRDGHQSQKTPHLPRSVDPVRRPLSGDAAADLAPRRGTRRAKMDGRTYGPAVEAKP